MTEDRLLHYAHLYFPLLLIFTIDRLTKSIVLAYLNTSESLTIIRGLLSFHLVFNRGIAFGVFASHGNIIVLFVSLVLLIGLFSIHTIPRRYYLPFGLVLGGAFGNMFDRFVYQQGVVDFISVPFFSVFNVADIAITFGIIALIISLFFAETHAIVRHKNKNERKKLRAKN